VALSWPDTYRVCGEPSYPPRSVPSNLLDASAFLVGQMLVTRSLLVMVVVGRLI
jgi:hypothetical protein